MWRYQRVIVKLYGNVLGHFFNHIWYKEGSTGNVYYINQPCIPSFPIGLIKTESDFIIRPVETGLRKWTLVVVVISVDDYPFLSHTWPVLLRIQEYVSSDCTVLRDSKETKLGSGKQEASPSGDKNTGEVLVSCCTWMCAPTGIFGGVDISKVPGCGCHLLKQTNSQWLLNEGNDDCCWRLLMIGCFWIIKPNKV